MHARDRRYRALLLDPVILNDRHIQPADVSLLPGVPLTPVNE